MSSCPFCRCDPYHYEDVGVCYVPVAIICCDMGIALFAESKTDRNAARRILRLRSSHSPRRKARAQKLLARMEAGEYP